MAVRICSATDVGRRRSANQDTIVIDETLQLFVVADGMGGHDGGDVASQMIAETVREFVQASSVDGEKTWPFAHDLRLSYPANLLRTAVLVANQRISEFSGGATDAARKMGATLAAALLGTDRAVIANVGDCRAYLMEADGLRQITRDHSWVADQVEAGFITAETARAHPWRNVVTRAIQGEPDLIVDVHEVELGMKGRLVLCSDGLHAALSDEEIAEAMRRPARATATVCSALIDAANAQGGPDNISVIVIDWTPDLPGV